MFIIASSIKVNPSLEIDNDSLLPVMSLLLATWLRRTSGIDDPKQRTEDPENLVRRAVGNLSLLESRSSIPLPLRLSDYGVNGRLVRKWGFPNHQRGTVRA